MSNGKAAKRLNALANSFRVSLRPLCTGMTQLHNINYSVLYWDLLVLHAFVSISLNFNTTTMLGS